MPEAARYREKAAELRTTAAQSQNAGIKEELIKLAEHYEQMASVIDAAAVRTVSKF